MTRIFANTDQNCIYTDVRRPTENKQLNIVADGRAGGRGRARCRLIVGAPWSEGGRDPVRRRTRRPRSNCGVVVPVS